MPVPNVATDEDATSSWANAVADSIEEIEADLYPVTYGQLAMPWASVTGKPATFPPILGSSVSAATSYGLAPAVGAGPNAAAELHNHGTPALPTAAQTGAVASYTSPATLAGGRRLYVGTATPTGASEGDVWIKG